MTKQQPDHLPKRADQPHKRIVSSSHLVSERAAELSEVEYGLIVASNAFGMWMVKAMAAALAEMDLSADLGVLDILCLHSVNHRGRAKKLADICFKLNVEDSHTVNYALKKLVRYGLVQSKKQEKEWKESSPTEEFILSNDNIHFSGFEGPGSPFLRSFNRVIRAKTNEEGLKQGV